MSRAELHFHLLPGVDDGPATVEESVALARAARRDGTAVVVATPHVREVEVRELPERVGRLEAERDQAARERDGLRAEVERLRAAEDVPTAPLEALGSTGMDVAPFAPSVAAWRERTTREVDLDAPAAPAPWWRRWWRRVTQGP